MKKTILVLFGVLFFLVPLILWPFTSEVFEFNKMVLVYILTTLIVAVWAARSVTEGKLIFRRTMLDIPLLVFLGSQLISTVLSIDPQTSWLGYYSRFNGGFASTACYSLLFWAFVSNLERKDVYTIFSRSFFPGAVLVSLYGVAEHYGIDKNLWVQDVQKRVFSTLGQPNWLAAWLISLMPITWAFMLKNKLTLNFSSLKDSRFFLYFSLFVLFFWTFIFTRSRSGLVGFAVALGIFLLGLLWIKGKEVRKNLREIGLVLISIVIITAISGTQFTLGISSLLKHSAPPVVEEVQGPALETGGTESGAIRRIVWKGALDIWANYPVFGTGVETFAFSYYKFRPPAHNLVSEWDFIYNKAHNEFLNMAANSGTVGLLSYLILIGFSIYLFFAKLKNPESGILNLAFLSGYLSLQVTNFFGFSVVPTQLMFFLLPALSVGLDSEEKDTGGRKTTLSNGRKTVIAIVAVFAFILLYSISKYWYADVLFNKGKSYGDVQRHEAGIPYLKGAIALMRNQAIYHNELSGAYASVAVSENSKKNTEKTISFAEQAVEESDKAVSLSPANLNIKRTRFGVFIMLSIIDPNFLIAARDTLTLAIAQAPTDAKLHYHLGLTYARSGQPEPAVETLKKTIELKPNYKDARLALAILLIDQNQKAEAAEQLNYILTYIDPADSLTIQTLESIK
ncbi:MAG TPA: O-antigen ligase family protein [Patescibacteria group bacterium]|nr:O-antigen ligase family protein [Patescibacteria group bacterium]